jgi:hypothetical protein
VRGRAVLAVPGLHERHVEGAARASRPLVVGAARPEQRDPVRRVVVVQGRVCSLKVHSDFSYCNVERKHSL